MTPDISRFEEAARRYCDLIDARSSYEVDAWLDLVAASLLDLAREGQRLPVVAHDGGERGPEAVTLEAWQALFRSLGEHLGERNLYWHVHDPTSPEGHDACAQSLADDLADIHRDVRQGLALWEAGRREQAAWEWRQGYWSHWGAHVVEALAAIHAWRRRARLDE